MRDLGLRHVIALTLSDKKYEGTIPLEGAAFDLAPEIQRMSQSETRETRAWLDECEAFIDEFHAPREIDHLLPRSISSAALHRSAKYNSALTWEKPKC